MPKQKTKVTAPPIRKSVKSSSNTKASLGLPDSNIIVGPDSKMSSLERLRESLTLNKIFFETIAATFLTLMAIILAWGQLKVTRDQTAYLEQQTAIERAQASPQFMIVSNNIHDSETNYVTDNELLVYNQGNIARKVEVETAVFFELLYRKGLETQNILVPISGYYWITTHSGDATGLVVTIRGDENFSKWIKIHDDLGLLAKANNASIDLNANRYVKLSYKDIFNNEHVEYYNVPNNGISDLLSNKEGEALFESFSSGGAKKIVLDLDEMTAQDLYDLLP